MGKTSLLRWVERRVLESKKYPVAWINAQGMAGHSPLDFVKSAAWALGRTQGMDETIRSRKEKSPEFLLSELLPACFLVDEAGALARSERGFGSGFFEFLRAACQDRLLLWISNSHDNLHELIQKVGLTSSFLNDSRIVWTTQLESSASRRLLRRNLDSESTDFALEVAGYSPFGLQYIGELLWRGREHSEAVDEFCQFMNPTFKEWWSHRNADEKEILRQSTKGIQIDGLPRPIRLVCRFLESKGLLLEEDRRFTVPGRGWREFVLEQRGRSIA